MCSVFGRNILFFFFYPPFLVFAYFQVLTGLFSNAHLRIERLLMVFYVLFKIIVTGNSRRTLPLSRIPMIWFYVISPIIFLMSVRDLLSVLVITLITILIISSMRDSMLSTLCLICITSCQIFLSGHSILNINTFLYLVLIVGIFILSVWFPAMVVLR